MAQSAILERKLPHSTFEFLGSTLDTAAFLVTAMLNALKLIVSGSALAVAETAFAKLRVFRVPELLAAAFLLAVLGLLVHLLLEG